MQIACTGPKRRGSLAHDPLSASPSIATAGLGPAYQGPRHFDPPRFVAAILAASIRIRRLV